MKALFAALAALALAGAGAAAWLWLLAPAALPARFGGEDCRRLVLTDPRDGTEIAGIEDIARMDGALILSAHDRLGGAPGGLYRLPLAALAQAGPVAAEPLPIAARHPHGIAAEGDRLAVIERHHGPEGHEASAVALYRLGAGGAEEVARWAGDDLCAANDLALLGRAVWATLDRADCPGLSMRDALGLRWGGALLRLDGDARLTVTDGLAFANGLVALGPGRLAVAETRGGRLARLGGLAALPGEAPPAHLAWRERSVELPGGPDNLTRAADGRIVAALHPSLLRLALYRHGWRDRAPSRLVALDPETGAAEALYDDPAGARFSGATVGLMAQGRLVAGSVRAPGLLVCAAAA